MFLVHLFILLCLSVGITIAIMYAVYKIADDLFIWIDLFDDMPPREAEARLAWIITTILLGVVIAWILM